MEKPTFVTDAQLYMIGIDLTLPETAQKIAELQTYINYLEGKMK